jgi:acetate kinase
MEFLGIHLDPDRNEWNAPVISSEHSRVTVRVLRTNEELMIAKAVYRIVRAQDRDEQPGGELDGGR